MTGGESADDIERPREIPATELEDSATVEYDGQTWTFETAYNDETGAPVVVLSPTDVDR